jgi:Pyridine nucleotide-disulphide oxidoreductase, dimerisation domain
MGWRPLDWSLWPSPPLPRPRRRAVKDQAGYRCLEVAWIAGAHVLGEYSAEVIQMVAACMASGMRVEEVAELQLVFPTFTEGVGMAAQMLARELGVHAMPQLWSSLSAPGS